MPLISPALEGIAWLGHGGLRISGAHTVYIDPFDIPADSPKADVILLTHPHYDHCSEDDIAKIAMPHTIVAGHQDCLSRLACEQQTLSIGDSKRLLDLKVTAFAAYTRILPYHPRSKGWLGFLLEVDGRRLYYAGDGDIESVYESAGLNPDIAFLPVDGLFTMSADSAALAAEKLQPGLAVPIHYGSVCGRNSEAGAFVLHCRRKGIPSDVLKRTGGAPR